MFDILCDPETGDILIKNGDLVVGESTNQHTNDIVQADKAWYKNSPKVGVGIQNYVNDQDSLPGLTSAIRSELSKDGQDVSAVNLQANGELTIQSSYPA